MTFDDLIEYCDGLPFLKRTDDPHRVIYEFIPEEEFDLCFYRGLSPCFLPNYRNQYLTWYFDNPPTLEQVFEKLSANGKENIIYHLDLFKKVFP
jgi:hypothetical protein